MLGLVTEAACTPLVDFGTEKESRTKRRVVEALVHFCFKMLLRVCAQSIFNPPEDSLFHDVGWMHQSKVAAS